MNWRVVSNNQTPSLPAEIKIRRMDSSDGAMVLVETAGNNSDVAVIFPGLTGDAWTHQGFISTAVCQNISCLCVTPKWATSTTRIKQNIDKLFGSLIDQPDLLGRIRFVRAVSYGAQLSLSWINQLKGSVEKIAWITPCSNAQILDAAKKMRVDLTNDDQAPLTISALNAPVRIVTIKHDQIVPSTDSLFLDASKSTQKIHIEGLDHFSAGNAPAASIEIANWFGERK